MHHLYLWRFPSVALLRINEASAGTLAVSLELERTGLDHSEALELAPVPSC